MRQDHLFEWYLFQQLTKRARQKVERHEERLQALPPPERPQTDLKKLFLAYNSCGKLSLADVAPTGFMIKAHG